MGILSFEATVFREEMEDRELVEGSCQAAWATDWG